MESVTGAVATGAVMVESGIAVVGRGEVRGRPDIVTIQLGVSVTRRTVAEANRDAAELSRALLAALSGAGVAETDIQTSNLALNPNYEYPPNRQPKLTGYTFANTVSAKLRDIDAAASVIDGALSAAGDNAILNGVHFALDDDAEAVVGARASAYADARSKAEQLAALAGVTLGAALAIEELAPGADGPSPMPKVMRMAAADAGPPLSAGEIATTVQVAVRFAIS
jgi:uncharacterized protein